MLVEMVPVKGGTGRDYITSQKARTISGIYCQLGDYILYTYHPLQEPEKSIEEKCFKLPRDSRNHTS